MNLTLNQLMGFGATKTQAKSLTKGIKAVSKQGRKNLYSLRDLIQAIDQKLSKARIRKATSQALSKLKLVLEELSSNVVEVPFGTPATENTEAVKSLLKSTQNSTTTPHKLKATELKGKRLSHAR